jgi:hypothetical protein
VCLLPGTELSFAAEVKCEAHRLFAWRDTVINHKTAIFRQINKDRVAAHHDALEFPDGQIVLLTFLQEGQEATVLQLPASAGVEVTQPTEEPAQVIDHLIEAGYCGA